MSPILECEVYMSAGAARLRYTGDTLFFLVNKKSNKGLDFIFGDTDLITKDGSRQIAQLCYWNGETMFKELVGFLERNVETDQLENYLTRAKNFFEPKISQMLEAIDRSKL